MLSRIALKSTVRAVSLRSSSVLARAAIARPMLLSSKLVPCTISSRRTYASLPAADGELAAALGREIRIENEGDLTAPAMVDSFLEKSGFTLENATAQDEVHLVRKDSGETVHVYFSISDIANSEDFMGDAAEAAESAAVDGVDPVEDAMDMEEDFSTPVRLNIVVEKPNGGSALGIEAIAENGEILVESMIPYSSGELAIADNAEADYKRRSFYQGPPFNVLDENVQVAVEEYLASRKIGSELAQFVVEYGAYKENIQYINWLEQIKKIVETQ